MKLWLLSRTDDDMIYDAYRGFVVAAETEAEARALVPSADEGPIWEDPTQSRAECIAKRTSCNRGVVLSSFDAG